jgi:hypothetical protein
MFSYGTAEADSDHGGAIRGLFAKGRGRYAPGLGTGDMIKPGAALINIGINQATDQDGKSRVAGDVDFDSCAEVSGWITPVPGGAGPVTGSILMRNAPTAARFVRSHCANAFDTPKYNVQTR